MVNVRPHFLYLCREISHKGQMKLMKNMHKTNSVAKAEDTNATSMVVAAATSTIVSPM